MPVEFYTLIVLPRPINSVTFFLAMHVPPTDYSTPTHHNMTHNFVKEVTPTFICRPQSDFIVADLIMNIAKAILLLGCSVPVAVSTSALQYSLLRRIMLGVPD